jgi:hypothetical protein
MLYWERKTDLIVRSDDFSRSPGDRSDQSRHYEPTVALVDQ